MMKSWPVVCLAVLGLVTLTNSATAAEPVTPPSVYPPDTWEGRSTAVVRVLDKLDAHVETLSIPAGQSGSYKSLGIVVRSCLQHPAGLSPDAAAFLTVRDGDGTGAPFAAWMFAAEPFIAVFESPVYGVQLVSCSGAGVAPAAPPLLPSPSSVPATPDPNAPPDADAPADTPFGPGTRAPADPDAPNPVYPSGTPDPQTPADGPAPPPD
jgi:hypothetical protein